MPEILLDEFARNKDRVAAAAARSLQSHFSLVRDAVNRFGEEPDKAATLKTLNEVDHAAILKGEAVNASISRIEKLLASVSPLPTSASVSPADVGGIFPGAPQTTQRSNMQIFEMLCSQAIG